MIFSFLNFPLIVLCDSTSSGTAVDEIKLSKNYHVSESERLNNICVSST